MSLNAPIAFRWGLEDLDLDPTDDPFAALRAWNERILATEDLFSPPAEAEDPTFRLHDGVLRWKSAPHLPVPTPEHAEGIARVRLRPGARRGVVVVPALTTSASQYGSLTRWLGWLGWNTAVVSLPDHDERTGAGREPGEDLVSPDLARTLISFRRAVMDIRRIFDFFEEQGCEEAALLGVSVGSFTSMFAALHDERVRRISFTYVSRDIARPIWNRSAHFRETIEPHLSKEELCSAWECLSSPAHLARYRPELRMQIFSGAYDAICTPSLTQEVLDDLDAAEIDYEHRVLDCEHPEFASWPHLFFWLRDLTRFFRAR